MACEHWEDCEIKGAGKCRLNLFGGRPSLLTCDNCKENTESGSWPVVPLPVFVESQSVIFDPVPFQEWPDFAKRIYSEREIPADKGVGDTVHRRLGDGGIIFAAWVALLGIPCGCQQRRDDWNMLYPYGDK